MGTLNRVRREGKTCLLLGETAADSAGLLRTEVGGLVLTPVVGAQSLLLGLVVHGKDAGNALAHELDLGELGSSTTGDLGDAELENKTPDRHKPTQTNIQTKP